MNARTTACEGFFDEGRNDRLQLLGHMPEFVSLRITIPRKTWTRLKTAFLCLVGSQAGLVIAWVYCRLYYGL